jgi:hypothetical protein
MRDKEELGKKFIKENTKHVRHLDIWRKRVENE